jgi:hypothetical protein
MTLERLSLADLLALVAPHMDEALVTPEAFARLMMGAAMLPPLPGVLLECRLNACFAETDLCVRATSTDGGHEILANRHPQFRLPTRWLESRAWQRIQAFCLEWMNHHSDLYAHIETIWLEFDGRTLSAGIPIPCCFVCLPELDRAASIKLLHYILTPLIGSRATVGSTPRLMYCLEFLPEGGTVYSIGAMFSRQTDMLRLCLSLPTRSVPDYLSTIGLGNTALDVAPLLRLIEPYATRIDLDLDIGQVIGPTVGLEVKPDDLARWPSLLQQLIQSDMCFPDKFNALLRWRGFSKRFRELESSQIFIKAVGPTARADDIVYVRRLNHVKFVHQPHHPFGVKVYLYVGYGWVNAKPVVMKPLE